MARLFAERRGFLTGWSGMETPEAYREFAGECRQLAARADMAEHKAILEEMARAWTRLAAQAESDASFAD
jgi:hypothetical protein